MVPCAHAYQIISQELHDEGGVLVALLAESIKFYRTCQQMAQQMYIRRETKLTGNSIIKGLLSKMACLIWRVQDLIVEHGEVESKAETDWVRWRKISLGNFGGILVRFERLIGGFLSLVPNSELG
jgi:hypothetical protein